MSLITLVLTGSLFFAPCTSLAKNEWTSIQGNAAHTGFLETKANPEKMHTLWVKKLIIENSKDGDLKPLMDWYQGVVISDHVAYFSMNYFYDEHFPHEAYPSAVLTAVDTITGKTLWQNSLSQDCRFSYPTLTNDEIYLGVNDKNYNSPLLISYNGKTGKHQRALKLGGWTIRTSNNGPVAFNEGIYISSADVFESIDDLTGMYNWSIPTRDFLPMPAINNNYIIQPTYDRGIEVINRRYGHSEFSILAPDARLYLDSKNYPIINETNNLVYFLFDNDTGLYAFNLDKQVIQWVIPHVVEQPILAGDDLYALRRDESNKYEFIAIDAVNGTVSWKWYPNNDDKTRSDYYPVVTADLIFLPFANKTYAISRKTHQVVWETEKTGQLALGENVLLIVGRIKNEDGITNGYETTAVALT